MSTELQNGLLLQPQRGLNSELACCGRVTPCAMVGLGTGRVFGCGMKGMPYAEGAVALPTIPEVV